MRDEAKSTKLVGVIGVAGFIVPAVSSVLFAPTWDSPDTDATAHAISAYIVEHRHTLLVGVVLNAIGVTLWGMFGVGIWLRLRRVSGGGNYVLHSRWRRYISRSIGSNFS
jgi:purine-cytosine permease-like protein